jgi:hypothetical protein
MQGPQHSSFTDTVVPSGQVGRTVSQVTEPSHTTSANTQRPERHATPMPERSSASQVDCRQLPSHAATSASAGFALHSQQLSISTQSVATLHSAVGAGPSVVPLLVGIEVVLDPVAVPLELPSLPSPSFGAQATSPTRRMQK